MTNIQNQNFGVEIELTGITRSEAAKVIANHYGTGRVESGYDYYNSRYAFDTKGRKWRCMSDASITCQKKVNGNTHAGKIKAYVQFCLAMSAWAINCENNNLYFKGIAGYTDEQKAAIMKRVLINRLGLAGPEYKTCRFHLTNVWNHAADTDAA